MFLAVPDAANRRTAFEAARALVRLGDRPTLLSWFPEELIPADRAEIVAAAEKSNRLVMVGSGAKTSGITAITNILRSESTGSIHVASSRPDTPPAIRFNFLSASLDREVTLEAMRITRRIMTAPAMAGIATDEIAPGLNISADDELLDWVRNNAETTARLSGVPSRSQSMKLNCE